MGKSRYDNTFYHVKLFKTRFLVKIKNIINQSMYDKIIGALRIQKYANNLCYDIQEF